MFENIKTEMWNIGALIAQNHAISKLMWRRAKCSGHADAWVSVETQVSQV